MSQTEKDGINLYVYAPLPRFNVRRALRQAGYLQFFDRILHEEIMSNLTSDELRMLDSDKVLWLRTPESVNYIDILPLLSPRQRALPRAVRALAHGINLNTESPTNPTGENSGQEEQDTPPEGSPQDGEKLPPGHEADSGEAWEGC